MIKEENKKSPIENPLIKDAKKLSALKFEDLPSDEEWDQIDLCPGRELYQF